MMVCMWRCQEGTKKPQEELGIAPAANYRKAPAVIQEYVLAANRCVKAGLRSVQEALFGLKSCGTVHLAGDVFDKELLIQLQGAYEKLHSNETAYSQRVDRGHIRAGRAELWPPFEWPFNASALLRPHKLLPVLKEYLGPDVVFDHMSIINAQATDTTPQPLHADVDRVRRHVEVHLPLVDVTETMGPTMFCPASHGRAADTLGRNPRTAVDYALEWWYLSLQENCVQSSALSYTQPLHFGDVTVYDASGFHAGTANTANIDRPVLQLSWAVDAAAIQARDYFSAAFNDDLARREVVERDVEAFRSAAENSYI